MMEKEAKDNVNVTGQNKHSSFCPANKERFHLGEECSCQTTTTTNELLFCEKCGKFHVGGKWILPDEVSEELFAEMEAKTRIMRTMCNECKIDDLCKTRPIAVCNER